MKRGRGLGLVLGVDRVSDEGKDWGKGGGIGQMRRRRVGGWLDEGKGMWGRGGGGVVTC